MNPGASKMRLPAQLASVRPLCEFASSGLPEQTALPVHLAVEEILVNIVRYGYGADGAGDIEVARILSPDALTVEISDSGSPFDPLQHEEPDLNASLEQRSIGGLGIFLAKKLASAADYSREDGRNTVRLRFDPAL